MKKRPQNRRKPDPITSPDMRAIEAKCHSAIAPLDRLANKMDEKWGIDRLVELVSPETAAKYGSALGRLNEALRAHDADQCIHMAKVCMRGLQAMNAEADASGAERPELLAEHKSDDGFHIGILKEATDWKAIKAQRPELHLVTLAEVVTAIAYIQNNPPVRKIKEAFPMGEVQPPKLPNSFWEDGGDPIPFGEPS